MHRNLSDEARAALDAGDIDALLAHHRDRFGGYEMKDDSDDDGDGDEDGSTPTPIDHSDDDSDGSDEGDDEHDGDDDGDDAEDDTGLGEKGQKALDRMKAERKELRSEIRKLRAELAEARNEDGEKDELETAREETKAERDKRIKAEKRLAAREHGLPESWADRLQGDDYEDFLDDAEALAKDLPTPRDRKGGGGAKEGHKPRKKQTLDDRIAEAEAAGDSKTVRALKAQKVAELARA